MKKFLPFVLFFTLIGCSEDFNESTIEVKTPDAVEVKSDVIPINVALESLYSMMDAVPAMTRAGFNSTKQIVDVKVCGVNSLTRANNGDVLPDTMAYVVNFADNEGFAVLGALPFLEPVYALTESGSFDADKLNKAIGEAYQQSKVHNQSTTRKISDFNELEEIGPDFAYELLADAMVATPRIRTDTTYVYGDWEPLSFIGPLVEVKWGQNYPFNSKMDSLTLSDGTRLNMPVGCTVVAAAQMMSSNRHPLSAPGESASYSWNKMKLVSNYQNLKNYYLNYNPDLLVLPEKAEYVDQLADVLHHIGKCFNVFLTDHNSTGADLDDVVDGLKMLDVDYYKDARLVSLNNNMGEIYAMLNNNKPLCVYGASGWSAHLWVIDGYLECARNVTVSLQSGYNPPYVYTRRQQGRMLHLNWGWHGSGDGYYVEGIFDGKQRQFTDEVIDANISSSTSSAEYSKYMEVILY